MKQNYNKDYQRERASRNSRARKSGSQHSKRHLPRFFYTKGGKVTIGILCVLLLVGGIGMISVYSMLSRIDYTTLDRFKVVDSIAEEIDSLPTDPNVIVADNLEGMQYADGSVMQDSAIQNILVIGSDTRGDETYGRSDSMIIVSIDRKHNKLKMTSLMRDMYLKIPGQEDNRINASYAWGGPALLIETIQENFKVKIDNYVRIDFDSFERMIDLVGGVPITISDEEAVEVNAGSNTSYSAGTYRMSGISALTYARIRHVDSDFGRTQRQRNVLEALIGELKSSNVSTMMNFMNEILPLVQTDLSQSALIGLATESPTLMKWPLSQARLPADGAYQSMYVREMSVLVPDVTANKDVLQSFIYE